MTLTREQLIAALTENVCRVTFTKLNGEVREMPCTLKDDIVPKYERKTPITESKEPAEVREPSPTLSVWCTDKAAWRSFRVDSVTNVEIEMDVTIVTN